MKLTPLLSVGLGGFIGCILRYVLTLLVNQRVSSQFPFATFWINILGSFVIGIVIGIAAKGTMSENVRLFFVTGICGGFTTFSAFSIENFKLIQTGEVITALIYIAASVVFAIIAAAAGVMLGRLV